MCTGSTVHISMGKLLVWDNQISIQSTIKSTVNTEWCCSTLLSVPDMSGRGQPACPRVYKTKEKVE
jgi:hypothetical protein